MTHYALVNKLVNVGYGIMYNTYIKFMYPIGVDNTYFMYTTTFGLN